MRTSEIRPGQLVLFNSIGVPPWPSFVLNPDQMPKDMFDSKPRGSYVPIIFVNEPLYQWVKAGNLKLLTVGACHEFLRSRLKNEVWKFNGRSKLKKYNQLLISAYEIAAKDYSLQKYLETFFPYMLRELGTQQGIIGPTNRMTSANIPNVDVSVSNNDAPQGDSDSDLEFVEEKEIERKDSIKERRIRLQKKARLKPQLDFDAAFVKDFNVDDNNESLIILQEKAVDNTGDLYVVKNNKHNDEENEKLIRTKRKHSRRSTEGPYPKKARRLGGNTEVSDNSCEELAPRVISNQGAIHLLKPITTFTKSPGIGSDGANDGTCNIEDTNSIDTQRIGVLDVHQNSEDGFSLEHLKEFQMVNSMTSFSERKADKPNHSNDSDIQGLLDDEKAATMLNDTSSPSFELLEETKESRHSNVEQHTKVETTIRPTLTSPITNNMSILTPMNDDDNDDDDDTIKAIEEIRNLKGSIDGNLHTVAPTSLKLREVRRYRRLVSKTENYRAGNVYDMESEVQIIAEGDQYSQPDEVAVNYAENIYIGLPSPIASSPSMLHPAHEPQPSTSLTLEMLSEALNKADERNDKGKSKIDLAGSSHSSGGLKGQEEDHTDIMTSIIW